VELQVIGEAPQNVLLLELALKDPPPSEKGRLPVPPPQRPKARAVWFQLPLTGAEAGLIEVWIRDAHRRVLVKLPIGTPAKM
jgi:hypothetical protein